MPEMWVNSVKDTLCPCSAANEIHVDFLNKQLPAWYFTIVILATKRQVSIHEQYELIIMSALIKTYFGNNIYIVVIAWCHFYID